MIRTPTFFIAFAIFLGASIGALPASAHTLEVEGTLGATLHIDPNDEPIAGSPSELYLDFKNSKREFDPSEYVFALGIDHNGTEIASTTLFANGEEGSTATTTYTFPEAGDYVVKITGTPKDGDEPTMFSFDTHVSTAAPPEKPGIFAFLGVHGGHVLIGVLLILILIVVVGQEKLKEYRLKKGTKS